MSDHVQQAFGDLIVRIERGLCIGSGNCMKVAGQAFEFGDEAIVTFKDPAEPIDRAELIEACQVCPVDALMVLSAKGEQIVP